MKTKRNGLNLAGLAALLWCVLSACADLAGPGGETIPPGKGLARIHLSAWASGELTQSARTALPDIGAYYFTLDFSAPGKAPVHETLSSGVTHTVALEPATWTLEVKGYTDSSHTDLKVSGAVSSVPITAGTQASFEVYLIPNLGSGATGSLTYDVSFPGTVSQAFLGFYPIDSTAEPIPEIDLSLGKSGTIPDLPEGSYRAVIDLYDGTDNSAAVRSEAVHIYSGLLTPLTRIFDSGDFAACPPKVGDGLTTLTAKLDAALGSSAGSYTIVLDGTEADLVSFTPKTLSVTGKNISITLRGKGETVQVSGIAAAPLFTLEATAGAGLALELRDITLRGLPSNSVPVVQVNAQGTLFMKAASLITGNTSSSDGGVSVSDGTFIMSGGAVSGNTSSSSGGGVYIGGGTFRMSGGAVSGNTSSSYYSGGGVYIGGGTFSMSGGAVSGNTSSSSGGGVYVGGGTFSMSGGAVSNNSDGGVSVSGAFSMSGGTVSGNGGNGVYIGVMSNGTFSMSGGAVSGNGDSGVFIGSGMFSLSGGVVSDNTSSGGGGVSASGGVFTMSGGAVSGNSSSGDGGGVSAGAFTMSGGTISGNISYGSSSYGGGVSAGLFTMSGGTISGNTSSSGGGVSVSGGTFTMSGGAVRDNVLSDTNGYGREVLVSGGTFNISGEAQPERVFLFNNTRFITISGPLYNGVVIPIDLGVTSAAPLTGYINAAILRLGASYTSGDMATLKTRFTLENSKMTDSPWTETPITGYEISDGGLFVALP